MATENNSIPELTVEELLGRRLNDVEDKHAKKLFIKGAIQPPLPSPRVSIVGSRKASQNGLSDARRIARTLTGNGVIIVSGLAEGIDTSAHKASMEVGGKTIAVLGTPLNKTYPRKNYALQQEIMHHHLVISQFPIGHPILPENFIARNRTMALISDATIIVEAADASGTRHQGWEAIRLGRPIFIWKSKTQTSEFQWQKEMLKYGAIELEDPIDVLESLPSSVKILDIFS